MYKVPSSTLSTTENQIEWCTPVISALRQWWHEERTLKIILSYIMNSELLQAI